MRLRSRTMPLEGGDGRPLLNERREHADFRLLVPAIHNLGVQFVWLLSYFWEIVLSSYNDV